MKTIEDIKKESIVRKKEGAKQAATEKIKNDNLKKEIERLKPSMHELEMNFFKLNKDQKYDIGTLYTEMNISTGAEREAFNEILFEFVKLHIIIHNDAGNTYQYHEPAKKSSSFVSRLFR